MYTVKEKGGKTDRKPYPLPYGFRNLCANLTSENSQGYGQKSQQNCTIMNSAYVICSHLNRLIRIRVKQLKFACWFWYKKVYLSIFKHFVVICYLFLSRNSYDFQTPQMVKNILNQRRLLILFVQLVIPDENNLGSSVINFKSYKQLKSFGSPCRYFPVV
jgi:hypothetical protein